MHHLDLYLHLQMAIALLVSVSLQILLFVRKPYWIRAHPYNLIYLYYLLKSPIYKYGHILKFLVLGLQHKNLGQASGTEFSS